MEQITTLVMLIIGLAFFYGFFIHIPATMAESRNRSAVLWVLVSLFVSPIAAIILLALLGRADR